MDDLIRRQDAIDALTELSKNYTDKGRLWYPHIDFVIDTVKGLPPAQSEQAVKDCRTCMHGKYNDHLATYFCYNPEYCSNCDKWEISAQYSMTATSNTAKQNNTCEFWDSESSFCALNRPSAQKTGIILTPCEGGADMAIGAEMAKGESDGRT